jgi:hypothetical protein
MRARRSLTQPWLSLLYRPGPSCPIACLVLTPSHAVAGVQLSAWCRARAMQAINDFAAVNAFPSPLALLAGSNRWALPGRSAGRDIRGQLTPPFIPHPSPLSPEQQGHGRREGVL